MQSGTDGNSLATRPSFPCLPHCLKSYRKEQAGLGSPTSSFVYPHKGTTQCHTLLKAGLALAAILPLAGCYQDGPKKPCIAVVDVVKIMTDSTPAKAGADNIQKAYDILQKGMTDLESAVKDLPEQQWIQETVKDQRVLQEQLNRVRANGTDMVGGILTDCVKEFICNA